MIAVSANEIATIEKIPTKTVPFESLIEKCVNSDIVIVEGLKQTVARKANVPKIAVTKTEEEAKIAQEAYDPIIAFSGSYNTLKLIPAIPYVNALENPEKLADLIEEKILKR